MKCSKPTVGSPTSIIVILLTALVISLSREGDCICTASGNNELFGSRNESHCELEIHCVQNLEDMVQAIFKSGLCNLHSYNYTTKTVYTFTEKSSFNLTTTSIDWNNDLVNALNTRVILSNYIKSVNIRSFPETVSDLVNESNIETNPWEVGQIKFDLNIFSNLTQLLKINASDSGINTLETTDPLRSTERRHNVISIIDLSKNRIREIPKNCFFFFPFLQYLNLSHNHITAFDNLSFEGLLRLETLDISRNMLSEIGFTFFSKIIHIKEISINRNNLTQIDKYNFKTTTELEQLDLSSNNINSIEEESFKYLVKLKQLDISKNNLTVVNQNTFKYNIQLNKLNLSLNNIKHIDSEAFKSIKNLNTLDLSFNNLSTIAFKTNDLKHLIILNAANNSIRNVSKLFLSNFQSLEKLNLSENCISTLEPGLFKNLSRLKYLDLSRNTLAISLQNQFFQGLHAITKLLLSNTHITSLSNESFPALENLKTVNISRSQIDLIEFNAFSGSNYIETLDISFNLLRKFDINCTVLKSLKILKLDHNEIQNLTHEVFQHLNKIEELNLANNNLTILDHNDFKSLSHLKVLDVSYNNIINVEKVIDRLPVIDLDLAKTKKMITFQNISNKFIQRLNLSLNDIETINSVLLFKIKNVEYLDLTRNTINFIDKFSFQNLQKLVWLDLSFNLISFIQPGAFLNLTNLRTLILRNNKLQEFQFGVLEGLSYLEMLNLTNNEIHEFGVNLIHSAPRLTHIALDKNKIDEINLEEFLNTNITSISIGDNPMPCDFIVNLNKLREPKYILIAEKYDYHSPNVRGITCLPSSKLNNDLKLSQNITGVNQSKAIDTLRDSSDEITSKIANNKVDYNNQTDAKKFLLINNLTSILQTINANTLEINNKLLTKLTANTNDSVIKYDLQEKMKFLNTIPRSVKLYFIVIVLTIIMTLFVYKKVYNYNRSKGILRRNNNYHGSTQPKINDIELKDTGKN